MALVHVGRCVKIGFLKRVFSMCKLLHLEQWCWRRREPTSSLCWLFESLLLGLPVKQRISHTIFFQWQWCMHTYYCFTDSAPQFFVYPPSPLLHNIFFWGGGGILESCSPSVCLSICLSVRLYVCHTFVQKISPEPLNRMQPNLLRVVSYGYEPQ